MLRPARFSVALSLVTAFAVTLPAFAENPSAPASAPAPASDPAHPLPTTPAPKPKRDRVISSELAASLAASMPKYNPPPKPKPEDEDIDLREVDKPRNGIVRLPKYTVQGERPPVFRERDIYSSASRTDLALRRYAGLRFGSIADLNRPVALAMYQEEQRLQDQADLNDTVRTVGVNDKADSTYLKRVSDETFMRSSSDPDPGDAWSSIRSK